jgi:type VI protein secretion system component VasK
MVDSYLQPAFTKFPFDRKAEADLAPSDLDRLLNPKGAFWKTFREYLAPLCQETGHTWLERGSNFASLRLPKDMLSVANDMSKLGVALWDEKGEPKPLIFSMKPAPLPAPMTNSSPVAVMAYLQAGKASVFGFNQQAEWQNFNFEWWKNQAAGVGVEFEDPADFRKTHEEFTIQESPWSFYRLLDKANSPDTNIVRWKIGGEARSEPEDSGMENASAKGPWQTAAPVRAETMMAIQFSLKSDPWAVFQLGRN